MVFCIPLLILLLLSYFPSLHAENSQTVPNITCPITFPDSFCYICNSEATQCLSCYTSTYGIDYDTGKCRRKRVGRFEITPNMINNVDLYQKNGDQDVLKALDPYCKIDPYFAGLGLFSDCVGCVGFPNRYSSSTSEENPRYGENYFYREGPIACHVDCEYAKEGLFYWDSNCGYCNAFSIGCLECDPLVSASCKECKYNLRRFGQHNIDNYLERSANVDLECYDEKHSEEKYLTYYVAPAGNSPRCSSGCSNTEEGSTGPFWDDLNMVFKDIIKEAAEYMQVNVKIYLLKDDSNLVHYLLDQDTEGFYDYDFYAQTPVGYLPRPFERGDAKVYIGPIYCETHPNQIGCLQAGEKITIKWKSNMAHIFVTNDTVIENIIFDGADMTPGNLVNNISCRTERKECCSYDPLSGSNITKEPNAECNFEGEYSAWNTDVQSYRTKHIAHRKYGIFVFEYLRDHPQAPIPKLTMRKVEVRNFYYSLYHTSFIEIAQYGAYLVVEDCVFDRFFFPHGLISNSQKVTDRNIFGFSSFMGQLCRNFATPDAANCHNITIIDSQFTNYNPWRTKSLSVNDVHSVEGAVIAVHNLDGPFIIKGCTFKKMVPFTHYSATANEQFDCLEFDPKSWGQTPTNNQTRHNIEKSSRYKVFLDKHFRKYAENKDAETSITAVIHIRNITQGIVVHNNTFDQIYTTVGGAVYIEGFFNTSSKPIIITRNNFTNNFAQLIGANVFIYKYSHNIPTLDCNGIFADSNTFFNTYGCPNTIGNVIVACEPNTPEGYSSPTSEGESIFNFFYETYAITNNHAYEVDIFACRNFTRFLMSLSESLSSSPKIYVHPYDDRAIFDPQRITFSHNIFERNYMRLSNGLYIQGAQSLLVKGNTFRSNSISTADNYSDPYFTDNAFKLVRETHSMATDKYMVESVPLLIRQSNQGEIVENIFDGNSQGFNGGDFYMAQAITLHQLIGKDGVIIANNVFQNHAGFEPNLADPSKGHYHYASSSIISFNFWEIKDGFGYIKGLDDNRDGIREYPNPNSFVLSNCTFRNNTFGFDISSDTKGYYFQNGALYESYELPFAYLLKYFNAEEVSTGAPRGAEPYFSSPVSYGGGPPMISLHVYLTNLNVTNNVFSRGSCGFQSAWFDRFVAENIYFNENSFPQGSNVHGFICIVKESPFSRFNNGSTIVLRNITSIRSNGTVLYLGDTIQSDPESPEQYSINIDSVAILDTDSFDFAPITVVSAKNVSIKDIKAVSFYGKYGLFYLDSASSFYVNGLTIQDSTGDISGLIYSKSSELVEFSRVDSRSNYLLNNSAPENFNWQEFAVTENIDSITSLVKVKDGSLVLRDSKIYDNTLVFGFISKTSTLSFINVGIHNITIACSFIIGISTTTISFTNSTVYNIKALPSALAGVAVADSSKIETLNSTFHSIVARVNGLFLSELSTVSITNSNISNIKVTGDNGILQSWLGRTSIIGTYIGHNTAGGEKLIFLTLGTLIVNGSRFENNVANLLTNNIYLKKGSEMSYVVLSEFIGRSTSNTVTNGQIIAEFLYVTESSITLDGVKLKYAAARDGALFIDAASYTVIMNNMEVYKNIATRGVVTVFANFTISNSIFKENTYGIYSELFYGHVSNVSFIQNSEQAISLLCTTTTNDLSIIFEDLVLDGYPNHKLWNETVDLANSERDSYGISLQSCTGVTIKNSVFRNLKTSSGKGAAIYISSNSYLPVKYSLSITGSKFENVKAYDGGALYIENNLMGMSQINIDNTLMKSCFATNLGAAIYYHNFPTSLKGGIYTAADGNDFLSLGKKTVIMDSVAGVGGGAIYYSQLRPVTEETVKLEELFINNQAPYGPNWASYPVSIRLIVNPDPKIWKQTSVDKERLLVSRDQLSQKILLDIEDAKDGSCSRMLADNKVMSVLVSGQQMNPPIVFGLVDIDGQIVGNWNKSELLLTWKDSELKIISMGTFQARGGYFILEPLILGYIPSKITELSATTSFDISSGTALVDNRNLNISIMANFRLCSNGERRTDLNLCELCPSTKYLFEIDSTDQCKDCPENMICDGGPKVGPLEGYSRFSKWNNRSIRCINDEACIGHSLIQEADGLGLYCKEKYNSTFCLTGWCSKKYYGNMCEQCSSENARSGIYCVSCTDNPLYYVLAVVVILAIIGFIIFTVRNAIKIKDFTKEGKKAKTSILIKIFTNFMQLISLVGSFDFQWPNQLKSMFTVEAKVASSTSEVFSIDCMLPQQADARLRPFFTKLSFIALSPIVLCTLAFVIWLLIFKCRKAADPQKFRMNYITTIVVLLFLIHTSIVQNTVLGLKCKNIGDSSGDRRQYYLDKDPEVECWGDTHLFWVFVVVIPSFVFWGIGIPLFAYILLRKNRNFLETIDFKSKFGFLYDGYKIDKYFWEFIILYRKLIMIFILVFVSTFGLMIQSLCVLGVSFLSYVFHIRGNPFEEEDLNQMERRSLVTATVTLYCGLFYLTNELPPFVSIILLIIIFAYNIHFLVTWFIAIVKEYKKEILKKIRKPNKLQTELETLKFPDSETRNIVQTRIVIRKHAEIDEGFAFSLSQEDLPMTPKGVPDQKEKNINSPS